MKIYIAGSFVSQRRLRPMRDRLFAMGHSVIGTWLDEIARPVGMSQEQFDMQLAIKDLTEVRAADCIILDNLDPSTTGGRMVEWGYAIGHHKLKYLVGKPKCLFERLRDAEFASWEELLMYFGNNHKEQEYVATGMEDKVFVPDQPRKSQVTIPSVWQGGYILGGDKE